MSGVKGLIDTNILIYLSNDLLDIVDIFERIALIDSTGNER